MRLLLLTILVCPLFAITNVGGTITENTIWGPTGDPPDSIYNLIGIVYIISPATLTIQPGTRIQSVGYAIEVYGSLIACGTPTDKVEFTSASPTPNPGDWPCILLMPSEPSDSILIKDCIIEYATSGLINNSTLSIELENVQIAHCSVNGLESWVSIPVENCEFTDNGAAGIRFYDVNPMLPHPRIGNNIIANNAIGILISGGWHMPNFTTPNQFANNDSDVVINDVNASVNDTLMWNPAIDGIDCYLQNTTVMVESTGVFCIAPGNCFKFIDLHNTIYCRGLIEAIGTEDKKIYFTSARQNPAPGDWEMLALVGSIGRSMFSHCVIEYAGTGIHAYDFFNIDSSTIQNCLVGLCVDRGSITNCSISNSADYGVWCHPSIDSILIINNIITGNNTGIYCELGASPYIYNNEIYGNTDWGVRNVQNDYWIMAEYNWWGDSTGPCDTSAVDTLYNPGGLGDRVSDHVDYDPWIQVYPGVREENPVSIPMRTSAIRATIFTGPLQLPQNKKCKVFDITGRVVMPDKIKPGIYFVEIDGEITKKVVKVR